MEPNLWYNFIINVEKSRYVKEKSKIPITVTYNKGLSKWSGLLDLALESGHVTKPSNGWYQRNVTNLKTGEIIQEDTKKYRKNETDTAAFWKDILEKTDFKEFIKNKYSLSLNSIMQEEETVEEILGDESE